MAVTLKDVAKACGIDICSVSVTLRNHPKAMKLREETRQRIRETACELGYHRNLLASSVRSGKNMVFGILGDFGPQASSLAIRQMLPGILREAEDLGYTAKIFSDENLEKSLEKITGFCIRFLISFITWRDQREKIADFCRKNGIRLVFVFEKGLPDAPAVSTDNFSSAKFAVSRLIALGHTRIAYLGIRKNFEYQLDREAGYRAALLEAGIPFRSQLCCSTGTPFESMTQLLTLSPKQRPTAVFALSDGFCVFAQNAALRAGLMLPDDLAMIGFGNFDNAETAFVPLSTMSETFYENGKKAVRLLLSDEVPQARFEKNTYYISGEFIQRESDVPPREKK